uniref:PUM-HD domain-containing protein n=1 Tax=Alexandrium andersonii TaxID=327968 RepID=A0A7S2HPE9_9DINO
MVQAVVKLAERAALAPLLGELHGRVLELMASQHGNFVLQAIVTDLPTAMSGFVVRELLPAAGRVARHRFGCRVICRFVEHSSSDDEALDQLLEELLGKAGELGELCKHPFAHYVVECILEHLPEHRTRIAAVLRADPLGIACHRCAAHVVDAALTHCSEADCAALVLALLGSSGEHTLTLAQHQHGSIVLSAVLKVPCSISEQAHSQLLKSISLVKRTKHGLRLLQDSGLVADDTA